MIIEWILLILSILFLSYVSIELEENEKDIYQKI
jgi:hypothetical protein